MALVTDPPTLSLADKLHAFRAIGAYVDPASFCALRAASKTLRDSTVVAGFRFWFERRLSQAPARGHKARMNAVATRGRYAWLLGADAVEFLLRALREDEAQSIRAAAALWLGRIARRASDPLKERIVSVALDRYDFDIVKKAMTSRLAIEENFQDLLLSSYTLNRLFASRRLTTQLQVKAIEEAANKAEKKARAQGQSVRAARALAKRDARNGFGGRLARLQRSLAPLEAIVHNRYLGRGARLCVDARLGALVRLRAGGSNLADKGRAEYKVLRGQDWSPLKIVSSEMCSVRFSTYGLPKDAEVHVIPSGGGAWEFAMLNRDAFGCNWRGHFPKRVGNVFRFEARYTIDPGVGGVSRIPPSMPARELWTFQLTPAALTYRVDAVSDYALTEDGYREVPTPVFYRPEPGEHGSGYAPYEPPPAPALKAGSRITTDVATAFLQWKKAAARSESDACVIA